MFNPDSQKSWNDFAHYDITRMICSTIQETAMVEADTHPMLEEEIMCSMIIYEDMHTNHTCPPREAQSRYLVVSKCMRVQLQAMKTNLEIYEYTQLLTPYRLPIKHLRPQCKPNSRRRSEGVCGISQENVEDSE